ncbi:MAG: 1,4-alpha-glucan branching protein domain-containing protein [Gemmatimonadales bacterium]
MRFVLVLHSHMPWVLTHGRWPHGADWLSEAVLDTYLPLLLWLERAEAANDPVRVTLGITPILAAQLAHPALGPEIAQYFAHRRTTLDEAPEGLRASGDAHLLPLVPWWQEHLAMLEALWTRLDGDLLAAFRRHAEAGRLELITSGATHGFMPLLARDESIRFQFLLGRAEHLRHFGELPRGVWVPECAYRPAGPWQPWPSAPASRHRVGIEDHLRHAGLRWFVVDAHLARAGAAWELYEKKALRPADDDSECSPYRAWEVGERPPRSRPVHVVVRDPETTAQVWSRHGGYPGDARYLEFHKIRYPGGLKLWRVTDPQADLGAKEAYEPDRAREAAAQHAAHFRTVLDRVAAAAAAGDAAIVAPFDTELFGHWWFEGLDFLADLYRQLAGDADMAAVSGTELLETDPPTTAIQLRAGSWGANGDFSKWLNDETAWTWERLWPLEERFWNAAPGALADGGLNAVLEQAARELLLAQSSDWQFIISTGAAGDYASRRFVEHCNALAELLPALEGWGDRDQAHAAADRLRQVDDPFPDLLGALAAASDLPAS